MAVERFVVVDRGGPHPARLRLARAIDVDAQNLDIVAQSLGLPRLDDFVGFPGPQLDLLARVMPGHAAMLDQVRDKWLPLSEGIVWLDQLTAHIDRHRPAAQNPAELLAALQQWRAFLLAHGDSGKGWRLEETSA